MPSLNEAPTLSYGPHYLRTGEAETGRVEAFSDGVLAIVITLLVLDVKIPEHVQGGDSELWHALAAQLPMIGAWAISFFFVLVFWVTHHYFFRQLAHVDRGLLWLNGLFLFTISFTPVPLRCSVCIPTCPHRRLC